MLHWRRGLYFVSLGAAVVVFIVGTIAEQERGWWTITTVIAYALWGLSSGLLTWSAQEYGPRFIRLCLYHMLCIAATLLFFSSIKTIDSGNLYLWVPVCSTIGIFVGVGVSDCCSLIPLAAVRNSLQALLASEDPVLPVFLPSPSYRHQDSSALLYGTSVSPMESSRSPSPFHPTTSITHSYSNEHRAFSDESDHPTPSLEENPRHSA